MLLETFKRANAAYEGMGDRKSPPPARGTPAPASGRDQVALKIFKLNITEGERGIPKQEWEEVTVAPGMESVLKDYGTTSARELRGDRGTAAGGPPKGDSDLGSDPLPQEADGAGDVR